mmetsp:Transcript_4423/g.5502  ORF Transcript_4423/g.5502 Transcript_4423/m.5502 type:complete len:301 (-) Transcript_4423:16-918(-)
MMISIFFLVFLQFVGVVQQTESLSAKCSVSPRLWLGDDIVAPETVELNTNQLNHLSVLRIKEGEEVRCFGANMGEWSGRLELMGRRRGRVVMESEIRAPQLKNARKIELCFAPLRKKRTSVLIEKATELGVTALRPIATQFTQAAALASLGSHPHPAAIQAAEQCERLDVPILENVTRLSDFLDSNTTIFVCLERQEDHVPHLLTVLLEKSFEEDVVDAAAVLIGPEGGFSDSELALFKQVTARPNSTLVPISLGSSILRAETAALSALAIILAVFDIYLNPPNKKKMRRPHLRLQSRVM